MTSLIKTNIDAYLKVLEAYQAEPLITQKKAEYYQPILKTLYSKAFETIGDNANQWGMIEGNILDQTDLIAYIASFVPTTTPTHNVLIDCGTFLTPTENLLIDCGNII